MKSRLRTPPQKKCINWAIRVFSGGPKCIARRLRHRYVFPHTIYTVKKATGANKSWFFPTHQLLQPPAAPPALLLGGTISGTMFHLFTEPAGKQARPLALEVHIPALSHASHTLMYVHTYAKPAPVQKFIAVTNLLSNMEPCKLTMSPTLHRLTPISIVSTVSLKTGWKGSNSRQHPPTGNHLKTNGTQRSRADLDLTCYLRRGHWKVSLLTWL